MQCDRSRPDPCHLVKQLKPTGVEVWIGTQNVLGDKFAKTQTHTPQHRLVVCLEQLQNSLQMERAQGILSLKRLLQQLDVDLGVGLVNSKDIIHFGVRQQVDQC